MRIKSLWISKYKNINDLHLNFQSNLISLLVGKNGLGKSNLIEILAIIFRDLDLLNKRDDFENWAYVNFEYEIHYECKELEIKIHCKEGAFQIWSKLLNTEDPLMEVKFNEFISLKTANYLPKYIIGYYSGENKRIRDIVRPYEEIIWGDLKKNVGLDKGFRRLFFAENHHAQLLLVTLFLYREQSNNVKFNSKVNHLLAKFTSIDILAEISLKLKSPSWYNSTNILHQERGMNALEENLLNSKEFPFWNAKGKANKIISFLYEHNNSLPIYYTNEAGKVEYLELNDIDINRISANVFAEFGNPINFFDAFESLFQIDALSDVILKIDSKYSGVSFEFAQLSEGEQQLITVLALVLIVGQDDCLFLLDEPDTHLNPFWQREYVNLLHEFNLNEVNCHIIVATHSPLIVQSAEKADIFLYKSLPGGQIEVSNEDLTINNWRIDQVLTSEYFDLPSARPPQLDDYMRLRERILIEGTISNESELKLKQLENEFGVLPTGETRHEIEALLIIKSITDRYQDQND